MNILDLLSKDDKKSLIIKNLKKDEVLFYESDLCEDVGIVIEGDLKIVSYLNDGKEIIYNTIAEDEIFGNNLIFSSRPYFKGNIISTIDSKIALIDRNKLLHLLKSNEAFLIEYLKIQSNFSKQLNSRIKLLSIDNAPERFYYYLQKNNNIIYVKTITELSENLHLQRETVSRLISRLIKENKIIREGNTIKLKEE